MKVFLETKRFILREVVESDVQGFFDLDSDPDVHEYLDPPIKSMEQAKGLIDYIRKQYKKDGIGRWAVIDKQTNAFVGWCGIKYEREVRDTPYYDLGYRYLKEYWGKGVATETALACLNYGFEKMDLTEMGAGAHVDNIASNKILKKLGFHFIEDFIYDNDPHNWYTLKREDWEKGR